MNQIAIGRFIAKKRKEQNLTQEQLAERLGVSNKTVSKWETGEMHAGLFYHRAAVRGIENLGF